MDIYRVLFAMAKLKTPGAIFPCCGNPWSASIQSYDQAIYLFYNDEMGSTHAVHIDFIKQEVVNG